jgi:hypothetical protein
VLKWNIENNFDKIDGRLRDRLKKLNGPSCFAIRYSLGDKICRSLMPNAEEMEYAPVNCKKPSEVVGEVNWKNFRQERLASPKVYNGKSVALQEYQKYWDIDCEEKARELYAPYVDHGVFGTDSSIKSLPLLFWAGYRTGAQDLRPILEKITEDDVERHWSECDKRRDRSNPVKTTFTTRRRRRTSS